MARKSDDRSTERPFFDRRRLPSAFPNLPIYNRATDIRGELEADAKGESDDETDVALDALALAIDEWGPRFDPRELGFAPAPPAQEAVS